MSISVSNGAVQAYRASLPETRIPPSKLLDMGGMATLAAVKGQVFKAFDADHDGKVSAQEIAKLGNSDPGKLADQKALVAAFDHSDDGALDVNEFGASRLLDGENLRTLLGVQDEAGVADWLIARADADGDGALSADEYAGVASPTFRSGRVADGQDASIEDLVAQHFGWTDADQDGRLSSQELATKLETAPRLYRFADAGKVSSALASRHDGDGDGALSIDELTAAAKVQDRNAVDDLMRSADGDGDMRLSADELRAAAGRRGPLVPLGGAPAPPSNGDMLLSRLLHSTLRDLTDQMVSDLGGALSRTA